jgi:hypothetical protein
MLSMSRRYIKLYMKPFQYPTSLLERTKQMTATISKKQKNMCSNAQFRSEDLRVMSPAHFRCATLLEFDGLAITPSGQ